MKFKYIKIYSKLLMGFSTFDFPACHRLSDPNKERCAVAGRRLSTRACARGVATLPTVILLGIMALVVAVGITTLSFSELMISQGGSQSSRALFYAESGARDALLKVARNKNYECVAADCYTIYFTPTASCTGAGGGCAKVSVGAGTTSKIATSTGVIGASTRTLRVSIALDTNGQIATSTAETVWTEI